MDQLLHDLTRDLPGWLGIVLVVVVVGGGWFGVWHLFAWARRSAERREAIGVQRARARAAQPRYAASPEALRADPDAWALAASAWLAHSSGQPLDVFAYRDTPSLRRSVLPRYYAVASPDQLWTKLTRTLVEGHRAWPHGDAEGPIDFVVWDLVRVIDLARIGAGVGVFDESEARGVARFSAATLQARYGDWGTLGAQLERAFRHTHEPIPRHAARLARIECDGIRDVLQGPQGPWSVVPWSTPVPAADLSLIDGAAPTGKTQAIIEAWERPIVARLARD